MSVAYVADNASDALQQHRVVVCGGCSARTQTERRVRVEVWGRHQPRKLKMMKEVRVDAVTGSDDGDVATGRCLDRVQQQLSRCIGQWLCGSLHSNDTEGSGAAGRAVIWEGLQLSDMERASWPR